LMSWEVSVATLVSGGSRLLLLFDTMLMATVRTVYDTCSRCPVVRDHRFVTLPLAATMGESLDEGEKSRK
jgi:hypothetical protein